jgi:hypothetical protein
MKARLADLGGTPLPGSPAQFGKLIVEETEKWGLRAMLHSPLEGHAMPRQALTVVLELLHPGSMTTEI